MCKNKQIKQSVKLTQQEVYRLQIREVQKQTHISFVIGVITIVIAFGTLLTAIKQCHYAVEVFNFTIAQNQPIFEVYFDEMKDDIAKTDVEIVKIENKGAKFLGKPSVEAKSLYWVEYYNSKEHEPFSDTLIIPILYWNDIIFVNKEQRFFAKSCVPKSIYTDVFFDGHTLTSYGELYQIMKRTYFKITYTDIYNQQRKCYFEGENGITEENYNKIVSSTSGLPTYYPDSITLKKIQTMMAQQEIRKRNYYKVGIVGGQSIINAK